MSLFGYFSLGLQSLNAAQFGLQVAGDNISNAFTPGYARRRADLSTGYPVQVPGGYLDHGVVVGRLRRMEDMFTQASLQRELGQQAGSEERLRGLRQVEQSFGALGQEGTIASALARFSAAWIEVGAEPDNLQLRRGAISAAQGLARSIRGTYDRLSAQRGLEDQAAAAVVEETNTLAVELAALNREIATAESSGDTAAPLRDQRQVIVEKLVELTGGSAVPAADGRLRFAVPGGGTLVTGETALPLKTRKAADGTLRILSGGDNSDITDRLREGKLGAVLYVRDDVIAARLSDLDTLAADIIARANTLTGGAFDLNGAAGGPLFQPDPPSGIGIAATIEVDPALLQDPALLAISAGGAPGEGDVADMLAALATDASAGLGNRSAQQFLTDLQTVLGDDIVRTDVAGGVSRSLVQSLTAQRDSVSAVSLDEEAVALIENQRAYEAAARFIQVLNSITETAVNLAR
jgi:flagellar hook-associated protein 1 FlgK